MNDTLPLISVIVPVYGVESLLDRCVKSILGQDYPYFELILIDDGSPDRCGEMCDAWGTKDSRVRVIHKSNGGLSSARNRGIEQVRGQYITFVDSDDWIAQDYLSYLLSLFDGHPACQVTSCGHYIVRGGKTRPAVGSGKDRVLSRKEAFEEVLFHGCLDVCAWAKLYRAEIFKTLRFPEGRIYEDTWLIGDVLAQSEEVICGSRCCYYYEIRKSSITNAAFREQNLQYIDAAEKLAADAVKTDPSLDVGGIRRVNHARLSTLRLMENCDPRYMSLRRTLRKAILADAPTFLSDARVPMRDRVAVTLLKMGIMPFYLGWKLYGKIR